MIELLLANWAWVVLFHFCTHEVPIVGLAVYGIYRYFRPKPKECPGHSYEEVVAARDEIVETLFENFTIHEGPCEKKLEGPPNEDVSCSSRLLKDCL